VVKQCSKGVGSRIIAQSGLDPHYGIDGARINFLGSLKIFCVFLKLLATLKFLFKNNLL